MFTHRGGRKGIPAAAALAAHAGPRVVLLFWWSVWRTGSGNLCRPRVCGWGTLYVSIHPAAGPPSTAGVPGCGLSFRLLFLASCRTHVDTLIRVTHWQQDLRRLLGRQAVACVVGGLDTFRKYRSSGNWLRGTGSDAGAMGVSAQKVKRDP